MTQSSFQKFSTSVNLKKKVMVLHHVTSGSVLILFYRKIEVLILFKEQYEIVPPWIVTQILLGFLDVSWSIMSFQ